MLNTLLSRRFWHGRHLAALRHRLEVAQDISQFTPEFAAGHTGISAAEIRRIARELAGGRGRRLLRPHGVSVQAYGALNQWLIQLINIATGNLDRPVVPVHPASGGPGAQHTAPAAFGRHHSRVRGLPEFDRRAAGCRPGRGNHHPGEGQIGRCFAGAGNPVLSTPTAAS